MRISVDWLSGWLGASPEPQDLAQRLTMAGGIEGNIGLALNAAFGIPSGFAVANDT